MNKAGASVVQYSYDSWGRLFSVTGSLADTVGQLNPFRYRGYEYDTETGLYYLLSRYYDPMTMRFVNADVLAHTGQGIIGTNMFSYCVSYCENNPIGRIDPSGSRYVNPAVIGFNTTLYSGDLSNYDKPFSLSSPTTSAPLEINPYQLVEFGENATYALKKSKTYTEYLNTSQAHEMQNKILDQYGFIDKFRTRVLNKFQSSILVELPFLGKIVENWNNQQSSHDVYVASGLYNTVVAVYERDGTQLVMTKTYSNMDSYLNTSWEITGYMDHVGMDWYGSLKPFTRH